jgi:ATP-dependent RNA helicase DDX24/MAK5
MKMLKQELRHLLSQPLFQENLKTRYPTQSGRPPQPVLASRNIESALSCLSRQKRRRKKPKEPRAPPQPGSSTS